MEQLGEAGRAEGGDPGITVVNGDVREPAIILGAVASGIDLTEPACLIMGYLLHFSSPQAACDLVASYAAALAPGSPARYLIGYHQDQPVCTAEVFPLAGVLLLPHGHAVPVPSPKQKPVNGGRMSLANVPVVLAYRSEVADRCRSRAKPAPARPVSLWLNA